MFKQNRRDFWYFRREILLGAHLGYGYTSRAGAIHLYIIVYAMLTYLSKHLDETAKRDDAYATACVHKALERCQRLVAGRATIRLTVLFICSVYLLRRSSNI